MPHESVQKPHQHLDYLDSARGIAALMVIAYHYLNWNYENHTGAKVASIIFNGSDAVSFFFVLSGFVLSYKYLVLGQTLDIRKYYVTRLFRLWPAFFITIVVSTLNANRSHLHFRDLTDIFILNKSRFWEEAFLLRSHVQSYIPGWTLVLELALSFFIPFWVVIAKKDRRIMYWLLFAYILIGNSMRDLYMFHFHFALGVLISCLFYDLTDPSFRETKWYKYRYAIVFVCGILYSIRHIDRIYHLWPMYTYVASYIGLDFFHYTAIASFVFIACLIYSKKAQKLMQHKLLLFLGRISYGVYLMHWFLVTDIFQNWDKIKPIFPNTLSAFTVVFFIYAGITILLATLLHYTIELPFIRLGKRWTKSMKPSVEIK